MLIILQFSTTLNWCKNYLWVLILFCIYVEIFKFTHTHTHYHHQQNFIFLLPRGEWGTQFIWNLFPHTNQYSGHLIIFVFDFVFLRWSFLMGIILWHFRGMKRKMGVCVAVLKIMIQSLNVKFDKIFKSLYVWKFITFPLL